MAPRTAGRPRTFDRDDAVREAARLFWQHGYSGTSTRMLTAAIGVSVSSLYAAFGSKAGLFDEAVRTYARRYSAIYDRALAESSLDVVLRTLLIESVHEFTRVEEGHPGCLTSSAVMADSSETLDVRAYAAQLQRADEVRLLERIERALEEGFGAAVSADVLAATVQTVWQGLSVRADMGAGRAELLQVAEVALGMLSRELEGAG